MLGNTLLAQAFDANTLHVTGDPIPIADQVERNPDSHRGAFSASQNGVLAYRPVGDTELVWFDRTGQRLQRVGPTGRYSNPALSPDNKQVAVAEVNPGKGKTDIWTLELARGVASRLTVDSSSDDMPLWSPDGQRIVFKSNRAGSFDFYQKPLSGSASEALLLKSPAFDPSTTPLSLSPDGRFFLYSVTQTEPLRRELWLQPLSGDRKPFPYLQTPFRAIQGQISPDGRWLAYASNDSGRNEVYLRPFPSGDGKTEVSVDGGLEPAWRADGRELFYLAGNQDLMAVPIGAGSAAHAGSPIRLFGTTMSTGTVSTNVTRNQYVVSADGQRFLINQPAAGGLSAPITLVVNWAVSLRK
jgi:Tol biopolymer transport system component